MFAAVDMRGGAAASSAVFILWIVNLKSSLGSLSTSDRPESGSEDGFGSGSFFSRKALYVIRPLSF